MKDYCQQCGIEIPPLRSCCSGHEYGCMGMPVDPPFCSQECLDEWRNQNCSQECLDEWRIQNPIEHKGTDELWI